MSVITPLMTPSSLLCLSPAITGLLQLKPTNYQHVQSAECSRERGRERKYKSPSATSAEFSFALLYRLLLQILCRFCCVSDVLMKLIQTLQLPSSVLWQSQERKNRRSCFAVGECVLAAGTQKEPAYQHVQCIFCLHRFPCR